MSYIHSSALVELVAGGPDVDAVDTAVVGESEIVVSSLTYLETRVQFRGKLLGGMITRSQYTRFESRLKSLMGEVPFVYRTLKASVFETALMQDAAAAEVHCRSLDRLHLAAMEELSIQRLLTRDRRRAEAARALGYEVIFP